MTNEFTIGGEILSSYAVGQHGSAEATYESLINADLPSYAHGFYSLTEFEQVSEIRYSKTEIGYDKELRAFHDNLQGAPMEAYVPFEMPAPPIGGSEIPRAGDIKEPTREIVDEIINAQREVAQRELIIQELEIHKTVSVKLKTTKIKNPIRKTKGNARNKIRFVNNLGNSDIPNLLQDKRAQS